MIRTVIYCRCSTEEESQQEALKKQVTEAKESVEANGWLLVDEYIESKSGTTAEKRNTGVFMRICRQISLMWS